MFNPYSLSGKSILVTGASSGLGWSAAIESARQGATVLATGRNESRLAQLLEELPGNGQHRVAAFDLSDAQQRQQLIAWAGALDGVVFSAGVQQLVPIRLLSEAMFDEVVGLNVKSPLMLLQQLLRGNRLNEGASLVLLSSIAAHSGTEGTATYAASKTALEGVMRVAALEVAKRKIRINALAPGMVVTPIYKNPDPSWFEPYAARYPLGLGKPEDIAAAVVFLLSDAAQYITGTAIVMDGGSVRV